MSSIQDQANDMTWEVAALFPRQGEWTTSEYLNLTEDIAHLVELTDGRLEVLEMPTTSHQQSVLCLIRSLSDWLSQSNAGTALMAPLRLQLRPGLFREPDIVFALTENQSLIGEDFWTGADLVMEVVSSGTKSRRRDLVEKRSEYADAGIREYWIIDPVTSTIQVLELIGSEYHIAGQYGRDEQALSELLAGFSITVNEVLGACK